MHTASEQQISRVVLIVILIAILALSAIVKILPHVEPTTPAIQPTQDIQTILQQETRAIDDQQQIAEIGWALVLYTDDLSPYGIPQRLYHVQLLDENAHGAEYLQLNVFAPSNLLEDDLMVRLSQDNPSRKEILVIRHEARGVTENDRHLYFVKRKTALKFDPIDEG